MSTETEEVIAILTRLGSKTGEFIQLQRLKQSDIAGGQVDEGFCRGVCIDWTRRILQGGKASFSDVSEKMIRTTVRQATIQANLEDRERVQDAVGSVRDQLVKLYNPHLKKGNAFEVEIPKELYDKVLRYVKVSPSANGKYKMSTIRNWASVLKAVADRYDHHTEVGWAAFANIMDKYHLQKRLERLRDEESGKQPRLFSHMKILASTAYCRYPGNLYVAVNNLLYLEKFRADTVMLLDFQMKVGDRKTGHIVAVNKRNNGTFYFLDPNFGVFDYDDVGLLAALRYLFAEDDVEPIYGEDGSKITGKVAYLLFGRARDEQAT